MGGRKIRREGGGAKGRETVNRKKKKLTNVPGSVKVTCDLATESSQVQCMKKDYA